MTDCSECGWELDYVSGRYLCTNPDCALSGKELGENGEPSQNQRETIEVSQESREIEEKLSFSRIQPIAKRLLPYLVATLDWGLNPEWKEAGEWPRPPRCFDPWFLVDVYVNTGLEAGEIEYFCRILKPSAGIEELSCEYTTGPYKQYRFKKKRMVLSPAFVQHLRSRSVERARFSGTGIDMLRAYFLLCGEKDPFDSLSREFDDEHWK